MPHKHSLGCLEVGPGKKAVFCLIDGTSDMPKSPMPTAGKQPWKKPMGQTCPHGHEFFLVDGTYIRNHFDSDWIQGGNGYRYPRFCPKRELWIDWTTPKVEWIYIAFHECHEIEQMKKGKSYEAGHDVAKRHENKARRKFKPGECSNKKCGGTCKH